MSDAKALSRWAVSHNELPSGPLSTAWFYARQMAWFFHHLQLCAGGISKSLGMQYGTLGSLQRVRPAVYKKLCIAEVPFDCGERLRLLERNQILEGLVCLVAQSSIYKKYNEAGFNAMQTTIPVVKAYRRRLIRVGGRVYETATEFVLTTWNRIEKAMWEADLVAPAIRVALSTLPQTIPAHLEQPFPYVDVCCFNEDADFLDAASKVPLDPLKEYFRTKVFRCFDIIEMDAELRFECSRAARGQLPNLTYKRLPELLTAPSAVHSGEPTAPLKMTRLRKAILELLQGKAFKADVLAQRLRIDRSQMYRDVIKPLRCHNLIAHKKGFGYFRPDAPPPG